MTTTAEPQTLADAGPCRWCADVQWDHKRGKGGCKVPGCGCDKYLPPKNQPAPEPAVEEWVVAAALGELHVLPADEPVEPDGPEFSRPVGYASDIEQDERDALTGTTPAEPATERTETLDVVRRRRREPEPLPGGNPVPDSAAQAESLRLVAVIDETLGPVAEAMEADVAAVADAAQLGARLRQFDEAQDEIARLRPAASKLHVAEAEIARLERDVRVLAGERDRVSADVAEANEARQVIARGLDSALADNARLRDEVDRANTARQKAQDALDEAYRTGLAASLRVLWQYDAGQCLTDGCGSRFTVPVDHPHPLTPVTVLVVERDTTAEADAPAEEHTKENKA